MGNLKKNKIYRKAHVRRMDVALSAHPSSMSHYIYLCGFYYYLHRPFFSPPFFAN